MTKYDYKMKNKSAARKLQKILSSPERRILEEQFATDHANDSDAMLIEYVKNERQSNPKFKRSDLIGYRYLVERFGCWEKLMVLVNRSIDGEAPLDDST